MPVIGIVLDLPDRKTRLPRILLGLDDRHSNERTIADWLQGGRFYEPDVSLALTRLVREGDCAVDIGAMPASSPSWWALSHRPDRAGAVGAAGDRHSETAEDHHGPQRLWSYQQRRQRRQSRMGSWPLPTNERSRAMPIAHSLQATTLEKAVAEVGLPDGRIRLRHLRPER